MYLRTIAPLLRARLAWFPGVVLLGPRQAGKTTLARSIADGVGNSVFLDLERAADRARLSDPELFFQQNRGRLVVLDEVQHLPELFAALRPEIDAWRQPGRFLLLGSASGKLLRQSAESLAGRVSYLDLSPLLASEVGTGTTQLQRLWSRGGFPPSYDATSDAQSLAWRQDFIRAFLERDIPQLGITIPAQTLGRFWRMLAHLQGQVHNASQLGAALGGVAHSTVGRYVDLLVDAMMVRRLEPLHANLGKRLVKSPKLYVRDSGLLHALLDVRGLDDLFGHPVTGWSWEGFVIEQVIAHAPAGADIAYYRTAAGAELDLVVSLGGRRCAVEVKFSTAPKPGRGFWQAKEDLEIEQAWVVAPVEQGYPIGKGAEVISIADIPAKLAAWAGLRGA